jgi:hypothetical protein
MQPDWQTWTALSITAIATGSLLRRAWKRLRSASSSCGTTCGACPSPKKPGRRTDPTAASSPKVHQGSVSP